MENNDLAEAGTDTGVNEESIVTAMLKFPELYASNTKRGAQKANDCWLKLAIDMELRGK